MSNNNSSVSLYRAHALCTHILKTGITNDVAVQAMSNHDSFVCRQTERPCYVKGGVAVT